MSEDQKNAMNEVFAKFDRDKSGYIDLRELAAKSERSSSGLRTGDEYSLSQLKIGPFWREQESENY
jgi:hypothetical protein